IPGVGLFLIISGIEVDNASCPLPNDYNEPYLRTWAGNLEYQASGMTCTIDDVPVRAIDDVRFTPYRVQSPAFSYTCPPADNYLHEKRSLLCYENSSGIPWTIDGAIIDGVFLMISPLSIGSHVIHATCYFPFNPPVAADFTYYLTVEPAPLNIALNQNR